MHTSAARNCQSSASSDWKFEDNFVPPVIGGSSAVQFSKLPDSDEYLAVLERKLKKIQQTTAGQKEKVGKDILKSLGENRESCMLNFLTSGTSTSTLHEESYEDFKVNPILNRINPEKQALGAEELVQLVKADQLELETVEVTEATAPTEDLEASKQNTEIA